MPDARQPSRKTTEGYWWKDKRYARMTCGHSIEISAKDPLPYEALCPECPPEPLAA